jgi:hypothetical protein
MPRTPEQQEADEALTAAIEKCAHAYGMIEEGWALGDWLICMEITPFAEDLVGRQRYGHITPYPTIPIHRLLGLLEITGGDIGGDDDG